MKNPTSTLAIISVLRRFVKDEDGFLRLAAATPSVGAPNASFTIVRTDDFPNVAPCGMSLRATGFTGFSASEPAGDTNVYDPVQHKLTVQWSCDDDAYTRISPINVPDQWKDANTHYGTAITHPIHAGGRAVTFTAFAFDDVGNWGIATYTTPVIQTRDAGYTDAATIYYSAAGNFAGVPGGVVAANRVTSWTAAMSRADALDNSGITPRVLMRRDEVYTNHPQLAVNQTIGRGLIVGAWGSGNRPRIEFAPTVPGFNASSDNDFIILEDLELIGGWDSTTESGAIQSFMGIVYASPLMFHRCRFSGWNNIEMGNGIGATVLSDCEVTNGRKFTLTHAYLDGGFMAIVNSALHCHVDALNGGGNETGNPEEFDLGNMHHLRTFMGAKFYIAMTSSFSCVGWSSSLDAGSNVLPPTATQAALRLSSETNTVRWRVMLDRVTLEGGDELVVLNPPLEGPSGTRTNANVVFDKVIFCATAQTKKFLTLGQNGLTFRNCYFIRPDIGPCQFTNPNAFNGVQVYFREITGVANNGPCQVYNCTFWIAGTTAQLNGGNPSGIAGGDAALIWSQSNNILYAPNVNTPRGTGVGAEPNYAPFTNPTLTGFVPRFKGVRWNFPPVGWSAGASNLTVGQARFNEAGVNAAVAPGEWVRLPWPNYAGRCNGAGNALAPLTPAIMASLPPTSGRHAVTVGRENAFTGQGGCRNMHDATLFPGTHNDKVRFDFTNAGGIRIQNVSGVTWPATQPIVFLPNLAPYLMAHKPGTASPSSIAGFVPAAGSAGVVPDRTNGAWALDGFLTDFRQGSRTPPSGTIQTGKTHKQGAFA